LNDFYAVLGISPKADQETIRKAYKKLALIYHPDRNPGDPVAENRFKEINEAYQWLHDPQKRWQYDAFLSGGQSVEPETPPSDKRKRRAYKQGFQEIAPFKINFFYFYFFLGMAAVFALAASLYFFMENKASEVFIQQAHEAYQENGNYRQALELLELALEKNSENVEAQAFTAFLLQNHTEDHKTYLYHYSQAIQLSENPEPAWYFGRAMAYKALDDMGLAMNDLKSALSLDAEYEAALTELGNLHLYHWKNTDNAKPLYEKLLQIDNDNVRALVGLGAIQQLENNFETSWDFLERAKRLAPDDIALRYFLGFHYLKAEQDTAKACAFWTELDSAKQLDVQNEINRFCR